MEVLVPNIILVSFEKDIRLLVSSASQLGSSGYLLEFTINLGFAKIVHL